MTQIGALSVDLTANTAMFRRDLKQARSLSKRAAGGMQRHFTGLSKGISSAFSAVGRLRTGLFALAGVGGLTLLAKRSIASADAIGKVADKVGVSTEALQQMRFAAEQAANVNDTTLDMALQRFSRRVGEAAQGSGELTGTLKQYNIEVRDADGNTRPVIAVLGDLADVISSAESNQEKLRISFKAFDSEGAALVNLMNKGREGIQAYADEADRLGIVLSDRTVRAAEKANEQFSRMEKIVGVNLKRTMIGFAPLIIRLGSAFAEAAPRVTAFLDRFLPDSIRGSESMRAELSGLQDELRGLMTVYDAAKESGNVSAFMAKNDESVQKLVARIKELKIQIVEAQKAEAAISGGLNLDVNGDSGNNILASLRRRADALKFETTLVGKNRDEKVRLRAIEGALITARSSGIVLSERHVALLEAEAIRVGDLTDSFEVLEKQQQRNQRAADGIGRAFASAFEEASFSGGKFSDVLRGLAIDVQRILFRRSVGEPLADAISDGVSGMFSGRISSLLSGGVASGFKGPHFAAGGDHRGGFRVVGERGPELEATGPARIFNAGETKNILSGRRGSGGGDTIINYTVHAQGSTMSEAQFERILERKTPQIISDATAAVQDEFRRDPGYL